MKAFNFEEAQKFELDWHKDYIPEVYEEEYNQWQERLSKKKFTFYGNWFSHGYDEFIEHIKDKKALEVGCGSLPRLKEFPHIETRIVIDPLAEEFKKIEEDLFGSSFFVGLTIYNQIAEDVISELMGAIDGVILCCNAIDHAEDPLMILEVMSDYAAKGCYLIFWSDIWHTDGGNVGHRSITRSKNIIRKLFEGLGWEWICDGPKIRELDIDVEYGAVFKKK